jgi:predicted CXXCH cytochrome family protein
VDEASLRCLGCHDGTVAGGGPGTGSPPKIGEASASHPIGIAYPPRPRPGGEGTFRTASSLPTRILLPEGRIGCLSCHDLFSGEEKLLVMANTGSRLCYACHDI